MIEQSFPSKRPVKTYFPTNNSWSSARDQAAADARGITLQEYLRRDAIVRDLAKQVEVSVYNTGYPKAKREYDSLGEVLVTGICKTYADFSKTDEWKDDNPMIVSFYPLKNKSKNYFCTATYLVKENPHVEIVGAC